MEKVLEKLLKEVAENVKEELKNKGIEVKQTESGILSSKGDFNMQVSRERIKDIYEKALLQLPPEEAYQEAYKQAYHLIKITEEQCKVVFS